MPAQHLVRIFAIVAINGLCLAIASSQDILVRRTQLGDPIVDGSGLIKYREDSGWSSSDFDNPTNRIAYDQQLSTSPWVVVYQANRQNAGLTASHNQLTLDLNGFSHSLVTNGGVNGFLQVHDAQKTGSFLRLTNGTVTLANANTAIAKIGMSRSPGRLFVNNAALFARVVHIGGGSRASGEITLEDNGRLLGLNSSSSLDVGYSASGKLHLLGDNSEATFLGGARIGGADGTQSTVGQVILDNPTALFRIGSPNTLAILDIVNAIPNSSDENIALLIRSGRVEVNGRLGMAEPSGTYAAILIEGGVMEVNGSIGWGNPLPGSENTSGGRIFLRGGEFASSSASSTFPLYTEDHLYWDKGIFRLKTSHISLTSQQVHRLTAGGAVKFGGERRRGSLATGQTLAVDGKLVLRDGIGLRGGTVQAGDTIETLQAITGYGTIDSTLTGTGTITSDNATRSIAIGALGGANRLDGPGAFRVGHLNRDTSYSGVAAGTGRITKEGTGKQQVTGSFLNTGGVEIQAGTLRFDGATARLATSSVSIAPDAHLQLASGATGDLTGDLFNAGTLSILPNSRLTTSAGVLNQGNLTVNGQLISNVTSSGRIGGTGTIAGVVDLLQGAVFAPGNSIGTLTVGSLDLASNAQMELEIQSPTGTPGTDWDLAIVSNLLSISATATDPFLIALKTLDLSGSPGIMDGFDPTQSYSWQFIRATISDPSQFSPDKFLVNTNGFQTANSAIGEFSVSSNPAGLNIVYQPTPAAVPESDAIWLLLGLLPLLTWFQKSRNAQLNLNPAS